MNILPKWQKALDRAVDKLLANKARYQQIEKLTNVPWFFIAICHMRESDANFNTYLGNGQSLSRRTTIVPVGRGPFNTFEEGAVDALKYEGLDKETDWSLEHILFLTEGYNGYGYMRMGKASPYVWGYTDQCGRGKYIRDGVYDPNAEETQPGTAALLKGMMAKDRSILASKIPPVVGPIVVTTPLIVIFKDWIVMHPWESGCIAAATIFALGALWYYVRKYRGKVKN